MSDEMISFADAKKLDAQRVFGGSRIVRTIGRRVHILADGDWRSYALSELIANHRCDHCGQPARRLERVIKYGRRGWLTCCLRCVEWHEERGRPEAARSGHR